MEAEHVASQHRPKYAVLVVDDEEDTLDACRQILRKEGYQVDCSDSSIVALEKIRSRIYDVVLLDMKMPKMDGMTLLREIKQLDPHKIVIMITGYATIDTAVESMKLGAFDYISKPFTPEELRLSVKKGMAHQELRLENVELKEKLKHYHEASEIVGTSKKIRGVHELIEQIAGTNATAIIYGETGTGKELVAKRIHDQSLRAQHPMITVNCAAIPVTLLESELFGHEKGAFTGAIRRKKGSFELADGGSLFLDEIGDMSTDLQIKLLRATEEKEIQPIGSERNITVDVRIIAATNRNLEEAMRQGDFREDLYYRLNVIPIYLPPLRDRQEDIPLLAEHFLRKYNDDIKKKIRGFTEEALHLLTHYPWPGNVRELQNAVERAVIFETGEAIRPEQFAQLRSGLATNSAEKTPPPHHELGFPDFPPLETIEKDYILKVLQATKWNRKKAAEILGISTVTIWRKVEKNQ